MSKSKTISDQEAFVRGDIAAIKNIIGDLPEFAVIERFQFVERLRVQRERLERVLSGAVELSKTVHVTFNLDLFDEISLSADDVGSTIPQYIIQVMLDCSGHA